jgi:hypothetical protein
MRLLPAFVCKILTGMLHGLRASQQAGIDRPEQKCIHSEELQ